MTTYQIQTKNAAGQWDTEGLCLSSDEATFESLGNAESALRELRKMGDGWERGEYRIVDADGNVLARYEPVVDDDDGEEG